VTFFSACAIVGGLWVYCMQYPTENIFVVYIFCNENYDFCYMFNCVLVTSDGVWSDVSCPKTSRTWLFMSSSWCSLDTCMSCLWLCLELLHLFVSHPHDCLCLHQSQLNAYSVHLSTLLVHLPHQLLLSVHWVGVDCLFACIDHEVLIVMLCHLMMAKCNRHLMWQSVTSVSWYLCLGNVSALNISTVSQSCLFSA